MKRAVAALGFFLLATSAHAELTVRASIGGLTFELVDLDPSDGVSPSIAFGLVYGFGRNSLYTQDFSESQAINFSGSFHEFGRTVINGPTSAEFNFEGVDAGTFSTRAGIHSSLNSAVYSATPPQETSSTEWGLKVQVSPGTLLKVSAIGNVEASADLAIGTSTFSDTSVYAALGLSGPFSYQKDQIAYSNFFSGDLVTFSKTMDETLSLSFKNDWSSVQTVTVTLNTWAYHSLAAVPEPPTSGLIVCGLLLLPILTRIRRMR